MPTIIDSLIVELGLDPSKLEEGQKKAVESLRKFESGAKQHLTPAKTEVEKVIDAFSALQGRLLAVGSIIAAGLGFNRLVEDATKANTELGNMSKSLAVSAQELAKWEAAGKTVGATANEMAQAYAAIQDALSHQQTVGGNALTAFSYTTHQTGQGPAVDLFNPDGSKRSPNDILMSMSKWYEAQQDKAVASYLLRSQAGVSQGMVNMLALGPNELKKRLDFAKQFAPSDDQIKQFQKLTEAFGEFSTVIGKLETLIAASFTPALTKILNLMTEWLGKIGLGQNPADVAGEQAAKSGFPEMKPNPAKPSLAHRFWNWITGKKDDAPAEQAAPPPSAGTPGPTSSTNGGGTRGDRNNNPGNLKYGSFAQSMGATGADGQGFAIFPSRESGIAAQDHLIKNNYAGLTLDEFGNKYAQGSADWKRTVGKELGIGPNDPVNVNDPRLLGAIHKAEGTSGPAPNQGDRPNYMGGVADVEGVGKFHWGSGSPSNASIPYGDYPVTPGTIGPWGQAHGALGVNNNSIWDPKLGRYRSGIELHASSSEDLDRLYTEGCFAVPASEWPQFKAGLLSEIRKNGPMYLHVGPDGARISHRRRTSPETPSGKMPGWLPSVQGQKSPAEDSGLGRTFDNWRNLNIGARGAMNRAGDSTVNTNTSSTHIDEMHVTVPPGADPAAYGSGIRQELKRYDTVQQSNTGLR